MGWFQDRWCCQCEGVRRGRALSKVSALLILFGLATTMARPLFVGGARLIPFSFMLVSRGTSLFVMRVLTMSFQTANASIGMVSVTGFGSFELSQYGSMNTHRSNFCDVVFALQINCSDMVPPRGKA